MFAIQVETEFCASHQLRLSGGTVEPLHGHNWHVWVVVETPRLDGLETVMDFHLLESALKRTVENWNHRHLNDIEPFKSQWNPSAERVAQRIGELLLPVIAEVLEKGKAMQGGSGEGGGGRDKWAVEVRVTEAPGCLAIWRNA